MFQTTNQHGIYPALWMAQLDPIATFKPNVDWNPIATSLFSAFTSMNHGGSRERFPVDQVSNRCRVAAKWHEGIARDAGLLIVQHGHNDVQRGAPQSGQALKGKGIMNMSMKILMTQWIYGDLINGITMVYGWCIYSYMGL